MSFENFINESLDKYYYFEPTNQKLPAYILAQYDFTVNGKEYAVRFANGSAYGKRVSRVIIGQKKNKNVSQKLTGISNFKMFFATVVAIFKRHMDYADIGYISQKASMKTDGFVIEVPEDKRDSFALIFSKLLKKEPDLNAWYNVNQDIDTLPDHEEHNIVLFYDKIKGYEKVFNKVDFSLLQNTYDEYGSDEETDLVDAAGEELKLKDNTDIENTDTTLSTSDFSKEAQQYQPGDIVYSESKKQLIVIGDVMDQETGGYNMRLISKGGVTDITRGLTVINDLIAKGGDYEKWNKTSAWQSINTDGFSEKYYAFTFESKPDMIYLLDWSAGITGMTMYEYFEKGSMYPLVMPIEANNIEKSSVYMVLSSDYIHEDAVPRIETTDSGDAVDPIYVAKMIILPIQKYAIDQYINYGLEKYIENFDAVFNNINKQHAKKQAEAEAEADMNAVELSRFHSDETDFQKYVSITKDQTAQTIEALSKYFDANFRINGNTPAPILIDDKLDLKIDYEDNIVEIMEKFKTLENKLGAKKEKIARYFKRFMRRKDMNSSMLTQRLAQLHSNFNNRDLNTIRAYTGNEFGSINGYLRGKLPLSDKIKRRINNFDEMFVKKGIQLPSDFVVYRGHGLSDEELDQDIVEMVSYSSCSVSSNTALNFTKINTADFAAGFAAGFDDLYSGDVRTASSRNRVIMSISGLNKIPVIIPGDSSTFPGESEIILPRGTLLKKIELRKRAEKIYYGHFIVSGIKGISKLLESNSYNNFLSYINESDVSERETELHVKTLLVDMLMYDYIQSVENDEPQMSVGEAESYADFFYKMTKM